MKVVGKTLMEVFAEEEAAGKNKEPHMVRICKQCEGYMTQPLHHQGKLWLFCSLRCKDIFDEQRHRVKLGLSDL